MLDFLKLKMAESNTSLAILVGNDNTEPYQAVHSITEQNSKPLV